MTISRASTGISLPTASASVSATTTATSPLDRFRLQADDERWKVYPTDDEPPELGFFCPDCVEREFDAN